MTGSDLLLDTLHTLSQRQEELWADAKIDGRVVFSVRETYKLHRERLIAIQEDIEILRWLVKACKGRVHQQAHAQMSASGSATSAGAAAAENCALPTPGGATGDASESTTGVAGDLALEAGESPLYHFFNGLIPDVFCRVAEHLGQNYGDVVKFIASWPVYNSAPPAPPLAAAAARTVRKSHRFLNGGRVP